jgi:hypothetical protein
MPAYNPSIAGIPSFYVDGAMPSSAPSGATASLGDKAAESGSKGVGRGEPSIVATLVVLAVGVIVAFHLAGLRAYFTVSAGK